jgi:hypothetical protein
LPVTLSIRPSRASDALSLLMTGQCPHSVG